MIDVDVLFLSKISLPGHVKKIVNKRLTIPGSRVSYVFGGKVDLGLAVLPVKLIGV